MRADDYVNGVVDESNQTIPKEAHGPFVMAIAPDAKLVPTATLSTAVREDGSKPGDTAVAAFFSSPPVGKAVKQAMHWDVPSQRWVDGNCARTKPDTVQIFNDVVDGELRRVGIFSEYLSLCVIQSIN